DDAWFDTEDEELLAGQPAVEVLPVELVLRPAEFQPLVAMVDHPLLGVRLEQFGQIAPMPIQRLLDHRVDRDVRQGGLHRLLGRSLFLRLFARAHGLPPDGDPRPLVPTTGFYRLAANPDRLSVCGGPHAALRRSTHPTGAAQQGRSWHTPARSSGRSSVGSRTRTRRGAGG